VRRNVLLILGLIVLLDSVRGQQVELTVRTGHVDSVRSLAFSHDGRYLATVGDDKTVRIWDVRGGQELRAFGGHRTPITAVAFSPDDRLLATVSHTESLVKVWEIETAKELWASEARGEVDDSPGDRRHTIAFSPGGKYLAVGRSSDASSMPRPIPAEDDPPPPPPPKPPRRLPNESKEEYAKRDQEIKDKAAEEHRRELEARRKAKEEKLLLESAVDVWSVDTGEKVKTLVGHTSNVPLVVFSRDGTTVIGGSYDRTIKIWDFETGKERATLGSFTQKIENLTLSHNGRFLACLLQDKQLLRPNENGDIKIWDLQSGQELRPIKIENPGLIEFSPDDAFLLNISRRGIDHFDIETGKSVSKLVNLNNSWVTENEAAAAKESLLERVREKREETEKPVPSYATFAAAFDSSGQLFAFSDWKKISIWNWQTKQLISELNPKILPPGDFIFSPDGKVLAIEEDGHKLALLNMQSATIMQNLSPSWSSLAFSPDSKFIAACDKDSEGSGETYKITSTLKLFNARTGILVKQFEPLNGSIDKFVFSPGGDLVAALSVLPDSISVWDVDSGRLIRTNRTEVEYDSLLTFSGDGKSVYFSGDEKLRLWNFTTNEISNSSQNKFHGRLAFSKDGRWQVEAYREYKDTLWLHNLEIGRLWLLRRDDPAVIKKLLTLIPEYYQNNSEDVISPDGNWRVTESSDGKIKFLDLKSGKDVADLICLGENWLGAEGNWLVTTPEGFFDGTAKAWRQVIWRFDRKTFDYGAVELYFNDFFQPNLLQDVLAGKSLKPPAGRELARIDRRQPKVEITSINGQSKSQVNAQAANRSPLTSRKVIVTVEVSDNGDAKKQPEHSETSGARDLRLFRNGSLVQVWHGDLFKLGTRDGCGQVAPAKPGGPRRVRCRAEVSIVAGENSFTAYAFNGSDVKSNDDAGSIRGADALKREGTLYVLAVGVNKYANRIYNLSFAVRDVEEIGAAVKAQQEKAARDAKLRQYAKTEVISLTDEVATKENILLALRRFAEGGAEGVPRGASEKFRAELSKIRPAEPEDALVIYFAGHGTSGGERFYLLPHDFTGGGGASLDEQGVSDVELNRVLEEVDAGRLLMVIDACQSGQALGRENEGRAPMNSKGLAQLAYDKGMYILTAAQSQQSALEGLRVRDKRNQTVLIEHGLLTYALLEGLAERDADLDGDGTLAEREWFDYAVGRVPQLQLEAMRTRNAENRVAPKGKKRAELVIVKGDDPNADPRKRALQSPRIFYRREAAPQPLVVATF